MTRSAGTSAARPSDPSGPLSDRHVLQALGESFACWDLGTMLQRSPLTDAWVLIRRPFGGHRLGLALRVGPCLAVSQELEQIPLLASLFAARPRAFRAAFPARGALDLPTLAPLGLHLDPLELWESDELSASAARTASPPTGRQPAEAP